MSSHLTSTGRFIPGANTPSKGTDVNNPLYAPMSNPAAQNFSNGQVQDTANVFLKYLGLPNRPIERPHYEFVGSETPNFYDAYAGPNLYVAAVIIGVVDDTDQPELVFYMPLSTDTPGLDIVYEELVFDDALLSREPEQSTPRLLTTHVNKSRTTLIRHGIGLTLECGYLNTEMGEKHYRNGLVQIASALVVTMCISVMTQLMNPAYDRIQQADRLAVRYTSRQTLDIRLRAFCRDYNVLCKSQEQFRALFTSNKNAMITACGERGDVWIMPVGANTMIEHRPEYWLPPSEEMLTAEDYAIKHVGKMQKTRMFEARRYPQGKNEESIDPTSSPRQISCWFTFDDQYSGHIPPDEYRSSYNDREIHSEASDLWQKVGYLQAVRATGVFNVPLYGDYFPARPDDDHSGSSPGTGRPAPAVEPSSGSIKGGLTSFGRKIMRHHTSWGDYMRDGTGVTTRALEFLSEEKRFTSFMKTFGRVVSLDTIAYPRASYVKSWLLGPSPPGSVAGAGFNWHNLIAAAEAYAKNISANAAWAGRLTLNLLWSTARYGNINKLGAVIERAMESAATGHPEPLYDQFGDSVPLESIATQAAGLYGFATPRTSSRNRVRLRVVRDPMPLVREPLTVAFIPLDCAPDTVAISPAQLGLSYILTSWVTQQPLPWPLLELKGAAPAAAGAGAAPRLFGVSLAEAKRLYVPSWENALDAELKVLVDAIGANGGKTTADFIAATKGLHLVGRMQLGRLIEVAYTELSVTPTTRTLMKVLEKTPTDRIFNQALAPLYVDCLAGVADETKRTVPDAATLRPAYEEVTLNGKPKYLGGAANFVSGRLIAAERRRLIPDGAEGKEEEHIVSEAQAARLRAQHKDAFDAVPDLAKHFGDDMAVIFQHRVNRKQDVKAEEFGLLMAMVETGSKWLIDEKNKINPAVAALATELALSQLYTDDASDAKLSAYLLHNFSDLTPTHTRTLDDDAKRVLRLEETKKALGHTLLHLYEDVRAHREGKRRLMGAKVSANSGNPVRVDLTAHAGWDRPWNELKGVITDAPESRGQLAHALLMAMPITYDFLHWGHEHRMPILMPLLCVRWPVHQAGTAIYMRGEGKVGLTFLNNANIMAQSSASRKIFHLHYTAYFAPVIFDAKGVVHNKDIILTAYHGGNNHLLWDGNSHDDNRAFRIGELTKDIVALPLAAGEFINRSYLDLTGKMNPVLGSYDEDQELHYSTANECTAKWGWGHPPPTQPFFFAPVYDPSPRRAHVTISWRDHHWVPGGADREGNPLSRAITHTGPFSADIYEGVGATRQMESSCTIQPQPWGSKGAAR
jgi:hypothetical protein